jgi:hypothetical protein
MTYNGFYSTHGYVQRGTHTRLEFLIKRTGTPTRAALTVRQGAHFPVYGEGSVLVNLKPAAPGTVTVHGSTITVDLTGALTDEENFVSFVARPDGTAYTDLRATATLAFAAVNGPTAKVTVPATVTLDRPSLDVHASGGAHVRAAGHVQMSFVVANADTVVAESATASITFSAKFTLNAKWGARYNNRRVPCQGAHRQYRCTLPRITMRGGGLLIDVHAGPRLRAGQHGTVRVVLTPRGYQNLGSRDAATARITVKR